MGEIVSNIYTKPYENRIMVTVDLSSSRFRAVAAMTDGNGGIENILSVVSVVSAGMNNRGYVANPEEAGKKIKDLLKKISDDLSKIIFKDAPADEKKPKIVIKDFKVSLSGEIISKHISKSRNLNGDRITQTLVDDLLEQVNSSLASEINDVFDIRTLEYNVDDDDTLTPVGMYGSHLVAGRYLVIESKDVARNNANWALNNAEAKFVLNNEALANVVLTDYDKECGCILLDMGSNTTTVSIYHNNLLRHYRVLPFGGNILTNDIKEVLTVSNDLAEEMKCRLGFATASAKNAKGLICVPKDQVPGLTEDKMVNVKELANILEARVEQLLNYVEGEICYAGVGSRFKVILAGGSTRLNRFKDKVKMYTGRDVDYCRVKKEYIDKYGHYFSDKNKIEDFSVCLGLLSGEFVPSVTFEKDENPKNPKESKGTKDKIIDWTMKVVEKIINEEDDSME